MHDSLKSVRSDLILNGTSNIVQLWVCQTIPFHRELLQMWTESHNVELLPNVSMIVVLNVFSYAPKYVNARSQCSIDEKSQSFHNPDIQPVGKS